MTTLSTKKDSNSLSTTTKIIDRFIHVDMFLYRAVRTTIAKQVMDIKGAGPILEMIQIIQLTGEFPLEAAYSSKARAREKRSTIP